MLSAKAMAATASKITGHLSAMQASCLPGAEKSTILSVAKL